MAFFTEQELQEHRAKAAAIAQDLKDDSWKYGGVANSSPFGALSQTGTPVGYSGALSMAERMMPGKQSIDWPLLSLMYFSQMGAEASKPGATVLGSMASAASAPAAYLMQQSKSQRERELKIPELAIKLMGLSKGEKEKYSDSTAYRVNVPWSKELKLGRVVNLTNEQYANIMKKHGFPSHGLTKVKGQPENPSQEEMFRFLNALNDRFKSMEGVEESGNVDSSMLKKITLFLQQRRRKDSELIGFGGETRISPVSRDDGFSLPAIADSRRDDGKIESKVVSPGRSRDVFRYFIEANFGENWIYEHFRKQLNARRASDLKPYVEALNKLRNDRGEKTPTEVIRGRHPQFSGEPGMVSTTISPGGHPTGKKTRTEGTGLPELVSKSLARLQGEGQINAQQANFNPTNLVQILRGQFNPKIFSNPALLDLALGALFRANPSN